MPIAEREIKKRLRRLVSACVVLFANGSRVKAEAEIELQMQKDGNATVSLIDSDEKRKKYKGKWKIQTQKDDSATLVFSGLNLSFPFPDLEVYQDSQGVFFVPAKGSRGYKRYKSPRDDPDKYSSIYWRLRKLK